MKLFYIPTTSINFNNILSSESISPKAFYKERSFGYGRWSSIPENPLNNSIVVYDSPFTFNRPASDYEDHPLLIEVQLDDNFISTFSQVAEHIFLCDKTIYLNPFTSRLLFFSENDKNIALSLSEASIETKLLPLYRKKIQVFSTPNNCPIGEIREVQSLNISEIEKDKKINRTKGLLYGYYIGGLLSSSKEILIKLNATREILNIYASILSSIDRRVSPLQKKNLCDLYQIIQPEIPLLKKLDEVKPPLDKEQKRSVISLIREEYGYIKGEYDVDRLLAKLTTLPTDPEANNPIIEETNKLIKKYELANKNAAKRVKVTDKEISISNLRLSTLINDKISERDKHLLIIWINEVFTEDIYNGRTNTFKEKLSDDVTRKAKDLFKTDWDSSKAKAILNDLRRHVRGNEFNYNWEDNIFSALASVLTKGDDWQKLLSFMQVRELTDYKLAFAIYGTLNGFANLPRDFSDLLYEQDREYVADVYKEFYKQLFETEIVTEKTSTRIQIGPAPKAPIVQPAENITETSSDNEGYFECLFNILRDKYDGPENKKEEFVDYYAEHLDKLCHEYHDRAELSKQIENIPVLSKTATYWKKVLKALISELNKVQEIRPDETNPSLFPEYEQYSSTREFLNDFEFLSRHKEFTSQASRCDRVGWKGDLDWFITNYKDPESKYYKDQPKDNKSVIDKFCLFRGQKYASLKELLYKLYLNTK